MQQATQRELALQSSPWRARYRIPCLCQKSHPRTARLAYVEFFWRSFAGGHLHTQLSIAVQLHERRFTGLSDPIHGPRTPPRRAMQHVSTRRLCLRVYTQWQRGFCDLWWRRQQNRKLAMATGSPGSMGTLLYAASMSAFQKLSFWHETKCKL